MHDDSHYSTVRPTTRTDLMIVVSATAGLCLTPAPRTCPRRHSSVVRCDPRRAMRDPLAPARGGRRAPSRALAPFRGGRRIENARGGAAARTGLASPPPRRDPRAVRPVPLRLARPSWRTSSIPPSGRSTPPSTVSPTSRRFRRAPSSTSNSPTRTATRAGRCRRWADAMRPGEERRAFKATRTAPEHLAFLDAYRAFVREVAPICGDPDGVVFQCPPTLRAAMPRAPPPSNRTETRDYPRHQPSEINFWAPVGDVWGNNALWLESTPGAGDFAPREMRRRDVPIRRAQSPAPHPTERHGTHAGVLRFQGGPRQSVPRVRLPRGRGRDTGKIGDYATEATGPVKLRDPTPA